MELSETDQITEINECRHIFHTECVRTWFEQKNECPLCKIKLDIYKPETQRPAQNMPPAVIEFMHEMMIASGQMQEYLREMRELQNAIGDLQLRRLPGVRMRPQEVEQAIIGLTLNAHLNQFRRTARQQLRRRAFEAPQVRAPDMRHLRFLMRDH